MRELIFNVFDVFNSETNSGCLAQYEALCFHIPSYQRGYKWASSENGPVTILLNDLWKAFKNQEPEYYLQYITVKRIDLNKKHCLEVIDGQQRLTTISILCSVLNLLQPNSTNETNIVLDKLDYAIRKNFFTEFVYQKEKLKDLDLCSWESFISADEKSLDRQDIFYLYGAIVRCLKFFKEYSDEVVNFQKFLFSSVKLIVNSVEPHIKSETVFKNLNSNKVPLTETELIKALFITRQGRECTNSPERYFREVMEVRVGLSRTWEDILNWTQLPQVKSFYFEDKEDAMHELLTLTAMDMDGSSIKFSSFKNDSDNPLFNYFNQFKNSIAGFKRLIYIQKLLKDWYETDELFHLIGFCRFAKNSKHSKLTFLKDCLDKGDKAELKQFLIEKKSELIFGNNAARGKEIATLKYGEDDDQIHAVLLALSVFEKTSTRRFDFDSFKREHWSLEHIFPQKPEGKNHKLSKEEKDNIRDLIGEVDEYTEDILKKDSRTSEEKEHYEALISETGIIDSIGNMCLLTGSNNSALGCKFFIGKRHKILELIQKGSFVPKHTFDVFSKMIDEIDLDLKQWSKKDITVHASYISKTISKNMGGGLA